MKHLIILILTLWSTTTFAEVTLVPEKKEIIDLENSENNLKDNKPEPKVKRTVSAEQKVNKKENDNYYDKVSIQLSNHFLEGNVYFGGKPTPIELNSYTFDLSLLKENYFYNGKFDYVFNQASIKMYNVSLGAGYKKDLGRISLMLSGNVGIVNYQENSVLQNISAYGPSLSAVASINFYITNSLYLNANYKYSHYMFTNSLSFWGSNPRGDVVFDFQGLGLGMGWSF